MAVGTPILEEVKNLIRYTKIEPESVRLNKDIPEEKFRVQFPLGCRVWDDFAQVGYVVGGQNKKMLDAIGVDGTADRTAATLSTKANDANRVDAPATKSIGADMAYSISKPLANTQNVPKEAARSHIFGGLVLVILVGIVQGGFRVFKKRFK